MPPTDVDEGERPFIDADAQRSLGDYLVSALEHATPDTWTAGGANDDEATFRHRPRNYDTLKEFEQAYDNGGPVADLTDKRALMTYGTGIEFQTEAATTDDRGRTVDEWLADTFGDRLDYLQIQLGVQSYWAGNAWLEIVEDRTSDFSHLTLVDPTTIDPRWDRHGDITEIEQIIVEDNTPRRQPLDPDNIAVFSYKDTPGGPLERGLYERNWDQIRRYAENQEQRRNAIRIHGSPKYHVQVGSDGQSISDRLLRRVRNRFRSDDTDEKTNWVTGGQVEINELDAPGFEGMESITETDIATLAQGFGIPLELTNFGSDGLGSGKPAEVRWQGFERQARAEQTLRVAQFMRQVVRPVLRRYSPFPEDIDVTASFGDVVSDQQAAAEWMKDFKSYMQPEEVRSRLDLPENVNEEDLGPPEGTPDADTGGDAGGLFATDGSDGSVSMTTNTSTSPARTDGGDTGFSDGRRALFHDSVSADALTQEELVWEDVYEKVLWADDGNDRALFEFDPEEVPDFVIDRLVEAVQEGALFDDFETVPAWAADDVEDVMLDSLETRHGWSVNSIANNLQNMALGLSQEDAERIARTETQALVNKAREEGYREEFDVSAERFHWVGPDDERNSEVCPEIRERVGDGVPLPELKDIVEGTAREFGHEPREWTPHINCRHTYTRVV